MKYLILPLLLLASGYAVAQKTYQLFSPDSSLRLEIDTDKKLSYQLYAGNTLLIKSSAIDLQLQQGKKMSDDLRVKTHRTKNIQDSIWPPLAYRKKMIIDQYRQLELEFRSAFRLQFRLYNNGMAYRLGTVFEDSIVVKNETAGFEFDKSANIWMAAIDKRADQDRFHTSYEAVYKKHVWASIADTMLTYAPVTISLPNGYHLAISDANLYDYPGMFLQKTKDGLEGVFASYPLKEGLTKGEFSQAIVTQRADYIARTFGKRMLPWRAVMVAKQDRDLPNNDLFYVLGDPTTIKDVSWLKPAKGTDEWITGINLFNVPFVAGLNTASYKYYIDFAAKFGFTQIMLDAGWSDYQDLTRVNPDIDMPELLRYAREKNVNLMLWTLCTTLDKQLDVALDQFEKWNVHSIMTDFMDRDDQPTVNFYHRIAKACAERKIAIMFHGAFPPKGFNRTWPNAITQEGVLGSEWNIWSELVTPEHDVAIAYTRMLAGPLDYEPGLLLNAQKDQFRPVGKNPMSRGTRCHQLAMFLVYDSPLQIFSGNISQGLLEPGFMQLLGSIPSTWDETKILDGKIGEYIITARRKGSDWYVAGLNNETARDISYTLDGAGSNLTYCEDGVNAHNYAADHRLGKKKMEGKEVKVHMSPGGGFLHKISME
ncbi:MAG TPA: glycoside hydrolase family 97 protein [Chitinophagaceae bacterium]|nr:glycoside hydrolase family 97 protein [Chitinophagaceae bacterium]